MSNIKALFNAKSVAVIGASVNPGKLGFHVMKSLTQGGFKGNIIPVNPGAGKIMGLKAYPSVTDFEGQVDLAIVVLPSKIVPAVFQACREKDVKGIVLITAGFREIDDPAGSDLQDEIKDIADVSGIPVIGPNTFGAINFNTDLNASFTPEFSLLKKGKVSLVSQSGGISHLLGFMGMRWDVGFSKIIGLGNRLNIDFPQMVQYLMDDPDTEVIALYMEGIDDPRDFLKKVEEYEGKKPVVIYKTGSASVGDQASLSHTGSIAGRHDIYISAFKQAGLLYVDSVETLLDAAKTLAICPLPEGPRVAVLSSQAGPAMAACDICEQRGMQILPFQSKTQKKINKLLLPLALRTNPVDMGPAWYDSSATKGIIGAVLDDDRIDGIILCMMFASANIDAVKSLKDLLINRSQHKPVISCIMSPPGIWDEQIKALEESEALVNFPSPERAARAMGVLWEYRRMRGLNDF